MVDGTAVMAEIVIRQGGETSEDESTAVAELRKQSRTMTKMLRFLKLDLILDFLDFGADIADLTIDALSNPLATIAAAIGAIGSGLGSIGAGALGLGAAGAVGMMFDDVVGGRKVEDGGGMLSSLLELKEDLMDANIKEGQTTEFAAVTMRDYTTAVTENTHQVDINTSAREKNYEVTKKLADATTVLAAYRGVGGVQGYRWGQQELQRYEQSRLDALSMGGKGPTEIIERDLGSRDQYLLGQIYGVAPRSIYGAARVALKTPYSYLDPNQPNIVRNLKKRANLSWEQGRLG